MIRNKLKVGFRSNLDNATQLINCACYKAENENEF
jgi:hypothetical protein